MGRNVLKRLGKECGGTESLVWEEPRELVPEMGREAPARWLIRIDTGLPPDRIDQWAIPALWQLWAGESPASSVVRRCPQPGQADLEIGHFEPLPEAGWGGIPGIWNLARPLQV